MGAISPIPCPVGKNCPEKSSPKSIGQNPPQNPVQPPKSVGQKSTSKPSTTPVPVQETTDPAQGSIAKAVAELSQTDNKAKLWVILHPIPCHVCLTDAEHSCLQLLVNQTFDIYLDSNPTTGFLWILQPQSDSGKPLFKNFAEVQSTSLLSAEIRHTRDILVLRQVYIPTSNPQKLEGVGGRQRFSFLASVTGMASVNFVYRCRLRRPPHADSDSSRKLLAWSAWPMSDRAMRADWVPALSMPLAPTEHMLVVIALFRYFINAASLLP